MLRITLEAFSGREDPSYLIDDDEARELLRDVSRRPEMLTDPQAGFDGLGFRGATVEMLSDDDGDQSHDLPRRFKVGGGATDGGNGFDVAERLIRALPRHELYPPAGDAPVTTDEDLVGYLLDLLQQTSERQQTDLDSSVAAEPTPEDVTCYYERSKFNPGFWNDDANIKRNNNCYNYASNRRTDTFAQPGRGAGAMYTALTCAELTRASLADGSRARYNCFPDAEKPRRLVALVVAPGFDYHWYRIHTAAEGFWGHKPGQTAARNTDNSNRVIINPETCDRGPYTQFCGYFYTCKTQANRIR
ncbi:insoluble matrix shell 1 domain protein [Rhodococcus sp. MTM3W5.2]|uniref:hypothetical protein n=1 Tax=Rhodococcus sp. MTM3W5.2 TaxID=1805827 RepID=UPI0009797E3F|nr:hypothetical protein [Rhodococcus sp. MTM3W5.2]AQA25648.1 insoluble matrix shell 1 domain protein [Rhodococcus sp. MTM3W5.2]